MTHHRFSIILAIIISTAICLVNLDVSITSPLVFISNEAIIGFYRVNYIFLDNNFEMFLSMITFVDISGVKIMKFNTE